MGSLLLLFSDFFSGKIMRFAEMSKRGQNSEVCVASEMSRFFFLKTLCARHFISPFVSIPAFWVFNSFLHDVM